MIHTVTPGTHFSQAVNDIVDLANREHCQVVAEFNSYRLVANPGDTREEAYHRWEMHRKDDPLVVDRNVLVDILSPFFLDKPDTPS